MLGSISPVGEASRSQRWWLTATAYTVASLLGGAATGAALGAMGQLVFTTLAVPAWARLAMLGAAVLAGAVADANADRWRLPSWRRQVNERWLSEYRGWVYGAGFGFQLGAGIATIVTSAVTYGALAAAVLTATWWQGLIVGVAFGAVRSIPLLATARLREPGRMHDVTRRVAGAHRLAHRVAIVGQVAVGAVAFVAAATISGA